MNKNSEYEKMPKNLKGLNLSEKAMQELNKVKWAVTEKVHGANFSLVYEKNTLRYAKRKEYLTWNDDFFGFQTVAVEIENSILALFEQLKQDVQADKYIIYGELFGGKYPNSDVPTNPNVQAIQTGVYYSPSIHFCAFDIAIETENDFKSYLDYETSLAYFERFNIFHAKVLFAGKWNEALNFNTRINSQIPSQLHLPELSSNLIEGVVIKPLKHSLLAGIENRPIIKLKNPEFDEEKKFHEAEKWSFIPDVISQSEELSFLVEEMAAYITLNRLNSALSKIGRLDFDNADRLNEVKKEFLEDIFVDFNEDNGKILDTIDSAKIEWLRNRMMARISEFINQLPK